MIKKILTAAVLLVLILQSAAFAVETEGEVVFRDALYGAAIGAVIGTAIYLADDRENFAAKFGVGVAIGTIGGLAFGVYETRSFAEIDEDGIKVAVPTPMIEKKKDGIQYSASILKAKF